MRPPVPLSRLAIPFLLKLVGGAFVIYLAVNYGLAPLFPVVGRLDWAGAVALSALRMLCTGVTVLAVPVIYNPTSSNNKDEDEQPPKTL